MAQRPESQSKTIKSNLPIKTSITGFRLVTLVAGPLFTILIMLIPAPESFTPAAWRLIALAGWMIIWWITEAVPIPVTALLPIPMMTLLNISDEKTVAASYGHPLIFLFLGGFLIAAAMQRWGLHRRIALRIVQFIGVGPSRIVAGFMVATAFLSMWISNTATAVMMYAVGISIVDFVKEHVHDAAQARKFGITLMLGIAYSASIGGVGTLIGTPPNILLAGFLADNYKIYIDFSTWMLLGIPLVFTMLPICWFVLCKIVFPLKTMSLAGADHVINSELKQLGRMSRSEQSVLVLFILAALLWILRPWLVDLTGLPITDTSIAMTIAILLFVLPVSLEKGYFALNIEGLQKVQWGVLLLFGGGLALAGVIKSTDLHTVIAHSVAGIGLSSMIILLITIISIILLTEITSNTAVAATFLPILGAVAVGLGESPLTLTIAAALSTSMAFMMPVATPPNAIVFSYDEMRIRDMMKAGVILEIFTITLVYLAAIFLIPLIFE